MFPAPFLHIHNRASTATTATCTSRITKYLLPLLHASSSYEPIILDTATEEDANNLSQTRRILLLTTSAPSQSNAEAEAKAKETAVHQHIARINSGRIYIPVTLVCGGSSGSSPLYDDDNESEMLNGDGGGEESDLENERLLVLDVEGMEEREVAGRIARWVWWVGEFMCWDD